MSFVIVFLGAGIGGALRHATNILAARIFGIGFPYGTLAANLIGCFLMAIMMETFAFRAGLPQNIRLFMTTGVLGGYTTFSTFALDAMTRAERQEWVTALLYVLVSVAGGFLAFSVGMLTVRFLLGQVK